MLHLLLYFLIFQQIICQEEDYASTYYESEGLFPTVVGVYFLLEYLKLRLPVILPEDRNDH